MSQPGEDLGRFTEPQPVTFDMGEGSLPLNATFHSPFIISDWRATQYKTAVAESLPNDITEQQLRDLDMGCHWAANRASRYNPYQTSTPRDYRGHGSELSHEESTVLNLLGREKFIEIHRAAPPAKLIDYMLTGGNDPLVRPDLSQITVAVIKGQISWEDRFADAGVPDPEDYVRETTRREDEYRTRLQELHLDRSSSKPPRLLRAIGSVLKRVIN